MSALKGGEYMNSKIIGIVVVVLVVVAGAFVLLRNNNSTSVPTQTTVQPTEVVVSPTPVSGTEASPSGEIVKGTIKEFIVTGSSFRFSPAIMTVNKGDSVKILFKNSGGMHNFVIDELGVETPVIQSGKEASVEFVANKAGTFEYYCSVGNHRQMGMIGKLTVK